jgi:hypothetical protein
MAGLKLTRTIPAKRENGESTNVQIFTEVHRYQVGGQMQEEAGHRQFKLADGSSCNRIDNTHVKVVRTNEVLTLDEPLEIT